MKSNYEMNEMILKASEINDSKALVESLIAFNNSPETQLLLLETDTMASDTTYVPTHIN